MTKVKRKRKEPEIPGWDSEGPGYDMTSAKACGLEPDKNGHWPSRCPDTGQLLKGRDHKTWDKLEEGENESGYKIYKGKDGKYYSKPKYMSKD